MGSIIEYEGYQASVEYSAEDHILFGRVLHINSLITFEATDASQIEAAFRVAVDEYLEHCERAKVAPNKTFSGTLNVRIGSERHKHIALFASKEGCSVNEAICKAIDSFFEPKESRPPNNIYIVVSDPWKSLEKKGEEWHWEPQQPMVENNGIRH